MVLTAFQALEGAASLRITLPNGNHAVTDQVLNWNRWGDWAMVKVNVPSPAKLVFAPPDSWSVGDRCFSLGTPAEGNRVILDENISGTSTFPSAGKRLNLTFPPDPSAVGAPVLNEYGEVIGVAGGSVYPGVSRRGTYDVPAPGILSLQGGLATPITSIAGTGSDAIPKTLAELAALNQFVPPLVEQQNLVYGRLTSKLEVKKDEYPPSVKPQTEFSKGRDPVVVLLVWSPREKVKGQVVLMVYDMNNKGIVRSNPVKLSLEKGQYSSSIFRFDPAPLPLGVYRIDVLLNPDPIWRGYFHLVE